jgi:flagellar assembly protein FliH
MTAEFVPHSGLIRTDDVGQGVPLKQSEITQFIRTIDTEVFEKQKSKKEAVFEHKSLFDLAKEASKHEVLQYTVTDDEAQHGQEPPNDIDDAIIADGSLEGDLIDSEGAVVADPEGSDAEAAVQDDVLGAEQQNPIKDKMPPKPSDTSGETLVTTAVEEAYQRGLAEGQKLAETEVEEMMSHALELLAQTTQAFVAQAEEATDELAASIEASVMSLASSRAGLAIDSMPEAFMQRIKTLADRVHNSTIKPIVKVHPTDLSVLKAMLEQSSDLLDLRLVGDEKLRRGDIDLTLEGVRLIDMLPGIDNSPVYIEYVPLVLSADVVIEQDLPEPEPEPEPAKDFISITEAVNADEDIHKSAIDDSPKEPTA